MDIESGKLYTQEEVKAMTAAERAKLTWIDRREYKIMSLLPEEERPKALRELRANDKSKAKKKRKAQRQARRKNR
jgi:hypothetical protein